MHSCSAACWHLARGWHLRIDRLIDPRGPRPATRHALRMRPPAHYPYQVPTASQSVARTYLVTYARGTPGIQALAGAGPRDGRTEAATSSVGTSRQDVILYTYLFILWRARHIVLYTYTLARAPDPGVLWPLFWPVLGSVPSRCFARPRSAFCVCVAPFASPGPCPPTAVSCEGVSSTRHRQESGPA